MDIKGLLKVCGRCECKVFLKYLGKGETDGGYTTWDSFESAPEGWRYWHDLNITLCPACSQEYEERLQKFMFQRAFNGSFYMVENVEPVTE